MNGLSPKEVERWFSAARDQEEGTSASIAAPSRESAHFELFEDRNGPVNTALCSAHVVFSCVENIPGMHFLVREAEEAALDHGQTPGVFGGAQGKSQA